MSLFQSLRLYLKGIPAICNGGCVYAALAMYKVARREGMNAEIVYLYDCEDDENYNTNEIAIDKETGVCMYCTHAVCKVNGRFYDGRGETYVFIYPFKHIVPETFAKRTIQECTHNQLFDSKKWVPKIEAFIGEKLL